MEATLYDNSGWSTSGKDNEELDLSSYDVLHLNLRPPPTGTLGSHFYLLEGKLEKPRLWSSEHVRHLNIHKSKQFILMQNMTIYDLSFYYSIIVFPLQSI